MKPLEQYISRTYTGINRLLPHSQRQAAIDRLSHRLEQIRSSTTPADVAESSRIISQIAALKNAGN
jgi:hypothetical protein